MTNIPPSIPKIVGPITVISPLVHITCVAPNALVEVFSDGNPIGSETAGPYDGELFVKVNPQDPNFTLQPGQFVTAKQTTQGGTSASDDNWKVKVEALKQNIDPPSFESILSNGMSRMLLGGMEPGATVHVHQNNTEIGKLEVTRPVDYVVIDPNAFLDYSPIVVTQEIVVNGVTVHRSTVSNDRVNSIPDPESKLGLPKLDEVVAYGGDIHFFEMEPSADCVFRTNHYKYDCLNVSNDYRVHNVNPYLEEGDLYAKQEYSRLELKRSSDEQVIHVGPRDISLELFQPCPETGCLHVEKMISHAQIIIYQVKGSVKTAISTFIACKYIDDVPLPSMSFS